MHAGELAPFLYSTAIGLLLGFERERRRPSGAPSAGLRTFALLAVFGTLCAFIGTGVVVAGLLGVVALLVVSYRRTNQEDPGTTTEVAGLATFLLGVLALHHAPLAAGLAIIVALLLAGKERLHKMVRHVVSDTEAEDALKFLIIAFVVLPLLPNKDLGPQGVLNPRHVWLIVVLLSAISWIGYIAMRMLGVRRGLLVAGLAGGFLSATATTASMGHRSREGVPMGTAVASAQIASVATLFELVVILAVVSRTMVRYVLPSVLVGAVLLALIAWRGERRTRDTSPASESQPLPGRPFRLVPAVILAGILTLALLVSRWGSATFGPKGAIVAASAAGLADAHAGAIASTALYTQHKLAASVALLAIGASLAVNAGVKCMLAFTTGGRVFGRRFALGVIPVYAVVLAGLIATAALM